MSKNFFNTISLSGDALQKANARALAQEDFVKELFLANPDIKLSPSQVQQIASKKYDRNCPITSWRRALTNLTYKKYGYGAVLNKTEQQVLGTYGLPEYTWELNKQSDNAELQNFLTNLQNEKPAASIQPELF